MSRAALRLWPIALDLAWNDPAENLRRIATAVDARLERFPEVERQSLLFVLPELALTGFVTKNPPAFDAGEATLAALGKLAADRRVGLVAGYPERNPVDPAKPFNCLALWGPDGRPAARYRKIHLFTAGNTPESEAYSAGGAGVVCEHRGWKLGLAICFDVRFTGLFHRYAREGVDALLVSACWIGGPHKSYQYRTINAAHAILTQSYLAAVNRAGKDPFYEYDGSEYVFSPFGEDVYDGGPVLLDPAAIDAARKLVVRPSDREGYGAEDPGRA